MLPRHQGIDGLHGRLPIGAALTIGVKGPSGAPTSTDRFFFVLPQDVREGKHSIRPLHPAFAAFNGADADKRKMIRGNLIHATREECFGFNLRAQVLAPLDKWPAHPQKIPACTGDGKKATRYYGGDDFREIDCPNDLCEFRQGSRKLCKPFAQILFRPRWPEGNPLPTPLTKLTTGSWHSTSALLGFFDYIESQAHHLGLVNYSLYGLPFTLTLNRKTKPQEAQAFPVLSISPECDLVQFFLAQRDAQARLAAGQPLALPAVTIEDVSDPETLASDLASIEPGLTVAKPSNGPGDDVLDGPTWRDQVLEAAASLGIGPLEVDLILGAPLAEAPQSAELEIRKQIAEHKS